MNSGTAALHLALLTLEVGPGDIVICPSVTFVASANVIGYVGATPHFVDCDRDTGNISPEALVQALADLTAIGHRPAAVMTVDLYGSCADYSSIVPICERFGVPIVEDAAEAIGANGLLCRVGSYFHDLGKLRKPEYFIENQAGGENKNKTNASPLK